MKTSSKDILRNANLIRYMVPLVLFLIVLIYETWEHMVIEHTFNFNLHWSSEILFFGIIGPSAVFGVLTIMMRLLKDQMLITDELESLNRNLETKVIERTDALAAQNQELAQANEELKQLDRMKSDFVSLVSHELRGPLTSLNGGLELALQYRERLPDTGRRVIEVMVHETSRLTEFVKTLLDVSQLDAGTLSLNCGPVAVEPMLNRLVELAFPEQNRNLTMNIPEETPPIFVDEIYIEKVICNLIMNADKYSPPDRPIIIDVEMRHGKLDIVVTDYGPGIPREMQGQVFKRFLRLEDRDRIKTKGWGLGLFFGKELAEAHGGELKLKSPIHTNGGPPGCEFRLSLPIADEALDDE